MIDLDYSITIQKPSWRILYEIPQHTVLVKGRKNNVYKAITSVAGAIQERYGCYAWGNKSNIYYCGSFAKDYRGNKFSSNLQGRIHNYLQNHKVKDTGNKNTNLMVFENINSSLPACSIVLYLFEFAKIQIGHEIIDFITFTSDSSLVQAVEQLLICTFHRNGQCQWNRT